ncbi:Uncharacterized protein Rs2_18452 [Raphanus sativus]|nr:Uncharacterized protein Rs2_18452 [Raphanus sativus]
MLPWHLYPIKDGRTILLYPSFYRQRRTMIFFMNEHATNGTMLKQHLILDFDFRPRKPLRSESRCAPLGWISSALPSSPPPEAAPPLLRDDDGDCSSLSAVQASSSAVAPASSRSTAVPGARWISSAPPPPPPPPSSPPSPPPPSSPPSEAVPPPLRVDDGVCSSFAGVSLYRPSARTTGPSGYTCGVCPFSLLLHLYQYLSSQDPNIRSRFSNSDA